MLEVLARTAPSSIFAGVDWWALLYAAALGTVMSLITTGRNRNAQRAAGEALTSWWTVVPDTLVAAVTAALATAVVPVWYPPARSFSGVSLLASFSGVLAPKLWDWVAANGLDTLLDWLAQRASGAVRARLAAREGDKHDDSKT